MAKLTSISDLDYYAGIYDGKCLSKGYIDVQAPVEWRCKKGHRFSLSFDFVKRGSWCRQCAKEDVKTKRFDNIKKIAFANGGKVLSKKYTGRDSNLKFKCAEGHLFERSVRWVEAGNWCGECLVKKKNKNFLEALKREVGEKGGKILSTEYKNFKSKLLYECAKGHKRIVTPNIIRLGHSCIECYREEVQEPAFEKLKKVVTGNGGKILSKKYINSNTKLEFQCVKGHKWKSTPSNITSNKSWCPICALYNNKYTIENMQELAKQHDGKCLSKKYFDIETKLLWRCKSGHTWKLMPKHVMNGVWCPECRKGERLKKLQIFAKSKGGKLLSNIYLNNRTPLRWQCVKDHIWITTAHTVTNKGAWCPVCARKKI